MQRKLLKLAFVIGAAVIAQKYANMLALVERGHYDLGGEMFVFPMVLLAGYYMTGLGELNNIRKAKRKRRREAAGRRRNEDSRRAAI